MCRNVGVNHVNSDACGYAGQDAQPVMMQGRGSAYAFPLQASFLPPSEGRSGPRDGRPRS
jgi:hypothetical protein